MPGAPAGLRVFQSSTNSVLVTWKTPDPPTGIILGYTLFHRAPHAPATTKHPLGPHSSTYTLHHLNLGTHYFWLKARTKVGEGPPTENVEIILNEKGLLDEFLQINNRYFF